MYQKLHKNARSTIAVRNEIQESKESISVLAIRYNLSRKTVRKWRDRKSTEDKSSRPNKINLTITKWEEDLILFERKQHKRSIDEIYYVLRERIKNLYPMKVYRCLCRYGLDVLPQEFIEAERRVKRFKKYTIGYLHIDVLYAPKINKQRRYVFTAIDRVSKIGYVEIKESKIKERAVEFLKSVIEFYPYKVNYILTDNGGEFCYNGLQKNKRPNRAHPFVLTCSQYEIEHRTIKFFHPWTNGMVERFNGKIKEKVFRRYVFETIEDLQQKLIDYINNYNHNIPLKGLQYETPASYLRKKYNNEVKIIKSN